jgi:hypothetical protein
MSNRIAIHEAGHSLGALAAGVRVREVLANSAGGYCEPARPLPIDDNIRMLMAGAIAEEWFGVGDFPAGVSEGDAEQLRATVREWEAETGQFWNRRAAAWFQDSARRMVGAHERQIDFLARHLDAAERLDERAIARLCHDDVASPLWRFKPLYPRPACVTRTPPARLSPRRALSTGGQWYSVSTGGSIFGGGNRR